MKNYIVKLDGKELEINTVRVSAMPYNKVFVGTQRPIEQTEEAYFTTADICGTSSLEITVTEDFKSFELRPFEFNLPSIRHGNTVTVTVEKPMQFTFEPDGFHNALHVFINPKSEKPSGEVIYFGKGEHNVGLIWLESGQTLYLEEGAKVYGIVFAKDAENIRISGRGTIDSSPYRRADDYGEGGREIYDELLSHGVDAKDDKYLSAFMLYNCKNVYVEGLTFTDAMLWAMIIRNHCENIVLDNIKIVGQWRYNSDGIDICASKNVTVKNSFVRAFDDCIVARAQYLKGECEDVENILVKNCVVWCDWGKSLEIWCGDKPCAIRNVKFEDNYLIRLTHKAISITTWYGSSRCHVENIMYKNIFINSDSKENRMDPLIEDENHPVYENSHGFVPETAVISIDKLGINVGNQECADVTDTSGFDVCYKNILFDNVRTSNPIVYVGDKYGVMKTYNISAENCDFNI